MYFSNLESKIKDIESKLKIFENLNNSNQNNMKYRIKKTEELLSSEEDQEDDLEIPAFLRRQKN